MLTSGDKLPVFNLPDQSGRNNTYQDLTGPQGLILFVYVKDNTSG